VTRTMRTCEEHRLGGFRGISADECVGCAHDSLRESFDAIVSERDALKRDVGLALRHAHDLSEETQSIGEAVDDLIRLVRKARLERDLARRDEAGARARLKPE
jgi:hypothetical protein